MIHGGHSYLSRKQGEGYNSAEAFVNKNNKLPSRPKNQN